MFADPQSLTVNGDAYSLPRIGGGPTQGLYATAEGNYNLTIAHQTGKRNRSTVRFDTKSLAEDPIFPAQNGWYTTSTYLVVDSPLAGITPAAMKLYVDGLTGWLTASSGANVTKLLGRQT